MKNKNLLSAISALVLISTTQHSYAANNSDKHKTNAPIEITSDTLQVLQQENKAIFTGHVIATQDNVKIKSEKMVVFYKQSEKNAEKPAKKSLISPPAASEKNSIEKIIVEKNVFLSTPEETASGANGIYNVIDKKIYLNDNVVLTRDKNVLKGNKLVYDFDTGKSELTSSDSANSKDPDKKQRVKALFVPNSDEKVPFKKER